MAKFRKKPVVIEAFQWTGGPDQTDDPEWIITAIRAGLVTFGGKHTERGPWMAIQTLEGSMLAHVGDYIIQGIQGEIYPCRADIFEATYEAVSP